MGKILIVDDSDLVTGILTQFFEHNGFDVFRAKNGFEGIKRAYEIIPDVIIMDVEMPVLQGYQASRILKSQRYIKEIPIIMHTSLTEDRDRFWADSSGVNCFINKDFDNLNHLLNKVNEYISTPILNQGEILEDASQLTDEKIIEIVSRTLDNHLYESSIYNLLGSIGQSSMSELSNIVSQVINLIYKVCQPDIGIIILNYKNSAKSFISLSNNIFSKDLDDFEKVSLNDFYNYFENINLNNIDKEVIFNKNSSDFNKERLDNKKLSSYSFFEIKGKGNQVIGTLHLGHISNNYFSSIINNRVANLISGSGLILENVMLFNEVVEMKDSIRHVFTKFVPEEIIDDLLDKKSDKDLMVGEKRNIVVLFSDIRKFSNISENNSPEDVVKFLNRYFDIQVAIIKKHGGNIDKFIGDAIFAIFGAPISYDDNAKRAARAANDMIKAVKLINIDGLNIPEDEIKIGIGLHEGDAIIGNIGASTKFDYTAIGDTVNIAARLESLTKHYKKNILLSEDIYLKISKDYSLREIDYVKVKGKDIPTKLFAIEDDNDIMDSDFLENYYKAYNMYKLGNFTTAFDYFTSLNKYSPNDTVVKNLLYRCEEYIKNPPEIWDGSVALNFK